MAIEQLIQAVIAASPAKRKQIEAAIRGETPQRPQSEDKRLTTITNAARLLALSRNTIYTLLDTGRLDGVELNGCTRVTMQSINDFAAGKRPANAATERIIAAAKARYAAEKQSA